jgi:hypothetical protein
MQESSVLTSILVVGRRNALFAGYPPKAPSFRADMESGCTILDLLCRDNDQVLALAH